LRERLYDFLSSPNPYLRAATADGLPVERCCPPEAMLG